MNICRISCTLHAPGTASRWPRWDPRKGWSCNQVAGDRPPLLSSPLASSSGLFTNYPEPLATSLPGSELDLYHHCPVRYSWRSKLLGSSDIITTADKATNFKVGASVPHPKSNCYWCGLYLVFFLYMARWQAQICACETGSSLQLHGLALSTRRGKIITMGRPVTAVSNLVICCDLLWSLMS